MVRSLLMMAMAFALMSGEAFAGGGGKSNGTLVVNNISTDSVTIVIDPPAAWSSWPNPPLPAQKEELAKKGKVIAPGGSQSFSVKSGAHKVLAVNAGTEKFTLDNVNIVKKQTTTITVDPK